MIELWSQYLEKSMAVELLGCIFLLSIMRRSRRHLLPNLLLGVVVCTMLYRGIIIKLVISDKIEYFPYLIRTNFPMQLLAIPSFYLYAKSLTTPHFRLRRLDLLHLIPALSALFWYFYVLVKAYPPFFTASDVFESDYSIRVSIKIIIAAFYMYFTNRLILNFERRQEDQYSDISALKTRWLRIILFFAVCVNLLDLFDVSIGHSLKVWMFIQVIQFLAIIVAMVFSIRVSPVFIEACESEDSVHKAGPAPSKTEVEQELAHELAGQPNDVSSDPKISKDALAKYRERLLKVVEDQKLFLNPELRLQDLSEVLGLKPYLVTEVIKYGFSKNFYQFINERRVEFAKALILDENAQHLNFLGIAMESGFKSKSVFNDVFKKMTGMTPSEYRKGKNSTIQTS